ncbi:hypothetical protein D3C81_1481760 [compost metagenome]
MGGRAGLRQPGGSGPCRGRRLHGRRRAGRGLRRGQAPPARRDGHPRLGQPLPGGAGGRRAVRPAGGAGLRPGGGRRAGHHPLRLARHGPPDWHRFFARDGDRRAAHRHPAQRPRTGLRAAEVRTRAELPGRHARGDQLRAGQPADPHPPGARGVRRAVPRHPDAAALRRVAQHLQGGEPHRQRRAPPAVRPPQGRHPRLRPRPPRAAPGIPRGRPAGADRRQHGHRVLGAGR